MRTAIFISAWLISSAIRNHEWPFIVCWGVATIFVAIDIARTKWGKYKKEPPRRSPDWPYDWHKQTDQTQKP